MNTNIFDALATDDAAMPPAVDWRRRGRPSRRQRQAFVRHQRAGTLARDIVARSIVRESDETGGPVFLTLAHLDPAYVTRRFPTIAAMCAQVGLDPVRGAEEEIAVEPAEDESAHGEYPLEPSLYMEGTK